MTQTPPPPPEHPLIAILRERMLTQLEATQIDILDLSAQHAGHPGAAAGGAHFRMTLVSPRFNGLARLPRHRLVYDALADLMKRDIHALSLTTLTPEEASFFAGK